MRDNAFQMRIVQNGRITAVDACSSQAFARHSHDDFGIGLMTGGAQRSWSGRGHVEAKQGNLITVNPAEVHDGMPIGEHRTWSMLYFAPDLISTIVADLSEGRDSDRELHSPVIDNARIAHLFRMARAAAIADEQDEGFQEALLALFGALHHVAIPASTSTSTSTSTSSAASLKQARSCIDDDPAANHTLAELARLAGLSRFQTLRGFTRLTGLTPRAYVIQRRLDLVRGLIRQGSTLADAAAAAGFADQSHMHRAFVVRYGLTPGAYGLAHRH